MQINKLLQTVVDQNASDLILTVGARPTLRLHGRLVPLKTKTLEPVDTVSLMKSITSERCQQELQEGGSTDFDVVVLDMASSWGQTKEDTRKALRTLLESDVYDMMPLGARAILTRKRTLQTKGGTE